MRRISPWPRASSRSVVSLGDDHGSALILQTKGGRQGLAAWRARSDAPPMAYALDGDCLLVATGAPTSRTVEFVRKLLGGARAEEVGTFPK